MTPLPGTKQRENSVVITHHPLTAASLEDVRMEVRSLFAFHRVRGTPAIIPLEKRPQNYSKGKKETSAHLASELYIYKISCTKIFLYQIKFH